MGTLTDSLFNVLMSWVRALVSAIWALFSSERTTVLEFLAKNWLGIAALIIIAGLVVDWIIWLIRWQPYHIWAMRARRLLRIAPPEDDEDALSDAAYMPLQQDEEEESAYGEDEEPQTWLPLEQPVIGEDEAQQLMQAAERVPDESLGQYPGMRYDSAAAAQEDAGGTRRYAAVHAEGPGAAEVSRRRAEIDAWQKQMQEEARQKAEAERAARQAAREAEQARLAQEAYEAEQARLAQEEYEAEQARLAQEAYEAEQARLAQEAYEAEQARLAQEEYERQLAEYERQKAQYERELAQYEREKAEYEAALERQARQQAEPMEAAQELAPQQSPTRRAQRRRRAATYSDYVEGEAVEELPAPPQWNRMPESSAQAEAQSEPPKPEKKGLLRSGMSKMAHMIEPEHEEIVGINALPPRVDMHAAYKPAKRPPKSGK